MKSVLTRTNRLALESSPYLLQHKHNPVDWYPWGPEALETSRRESMPIFLSVGYSTCYWCHVMERQCFEVPAIAAEMNKRFICIKVDREERPDIDQLYMLAVQLLTRHGGWPMSVFLLPDLRPFYGGTYFPPDDTQGRPGLPTLLKVLDEATRSRKQEVHSSAAQIAAALAELGKPQPPAKSTLIDETLLNRLITRSTSDFDSRHGGFGSAPKFPRETLIELLLVRQRTRPDPTQMDRLLQSLDAMMHGGIRDQLGGGFHRYSTDGEWLIPHFEIMLYDNAMLGWCYAEAFDQTRDDRYAAVSRGIFDFILSDMTAPTGGFYTALDAEVDAREGMPYLWTRSEIEAVLAAKLGDSPDAEKRIANFCRIYGLDTGPNFADPHHGNGIPDCNVLFVAEPDSSPSPLLDPTLAPLREALLAERKSRKQPLLDTKIITAWNGLMIRALAHGGRVLGEPRYTQAAEKAAQFLLDHHRTPEGSLRRTSRDGIAKTAAFLDDYAFLVHAMLDVSTAAENRDWTEEAKKLAATMVEKFHDPIDGGFFFTESGATDLLVRQKVSGDSPLPSGNAIAALAMLALGDVDICRRTIEVFGGQLLSNAESMSAMLEAIGAYLAGHDAITVAPGGNAPAKSAGPVSLSAEWIDGRQLHVHVAIAEGFHINGHEASAGLLATQLSIAGPSSAAVESIAYPSAGAMTFAFADESINAYAGEFTIKVSFATPPAADAPVKLSLRFQACTNNACLSPATQSVVITAN